MEIRFLKLELDCSQSPYFSLGFSRIQRQKYGDCEQSKLECSPAIYFEISQKQNTLPDN